MYWLWIKLSFLVLCIYSNLIDAIQPSKDLLEFPVGPVTRLRLRSSKKLSMDFFKIHGLMWTSRGFVIIKSKPWLILFMFKRGCWWNQDHYTRIGRRRLDLDSLTFRYSFGHNWSCRSNFDVIPVGLETRLLYISNGIWHAF